MRRAQSTWVVLAVAFLTVLNSSAHVASAARGMPDPLLIQFENGFGIVAAEVVDAKLLGKEHDYPTYYETTFKVHEVVAQPLKGESFPLHAGDSLNLRLSVGYACQVEGDVKAELAQGRCYYLIVRKKSDGTYEHTWGASPLIGVEKFEDSETHFYARVRSLAAEPEKTRLTAWANVVKSATESDRLRHTALAGIDSTLWVRDDAPGADEARALLREVWNDPRSQSSFELLLHLDYVLGHRPEFANSGDRRDVWLKYLLTLTPERKKHDNGLENAAEAIFVSLAESHPEIVGQQLEAQLLNKEWPPFFRRAIACGLLTAYRFAKQIDPAWEKTLQIYFVELMKDGEPWMIENAADDLKDCGGIKSSGDTRARRRYEPGADFTEAMRSAIDRLKVASCTPGRHQPREEEAASRLGGLIETLNDLQK